MSNGDGKDAILGAYNFKRSSCHSFHLIHRARVQVTIIRECERLRYLVRVKLLATEVVHRNQFVSRALINL